MSDSLILTKAKAFAIRVVKLHKYLRGKREATMSKQILRCGTSIGANLAEAKYAQSKDDFISKQAIALKEAGETIYWLELLRDVDLIPDNDAYRTIYADCEELIRLLVAIETAIKCIDSRVAALHQTHDHTICSTWDSTQRRKGAKTQRGRCHYFDRITRISREDRLPKNSKHPSEAFFAPLRLCVKNRVRILRCFVFDALHL